MFTSFIYIDVHRACDVAKVYRIFRSTEVRAAVCNYKR